MAKGKSRKKAKKPARKKTPKKKGKKPMAKRKSRKKGKKRSSRKTTTKRKTTTRRRTTTSRKTRPRRRSASGTSLEKKIKTALAGGAGAGVGALIGPAAQYASKQTGLTGEVIAAAVPLALGAAIYTKSKKGPLQDFGGGMALMGVSLGLLSGFRRIKSKIPGLEKIDLGPLGARVPRLYTNGTTSQLLIRGNDGVLHPIRTTGALGQRKKTVVLPSGEKITGHSLGTAEVDGKKYMPLYMPDRGQLKLIALSGAVPAGSEAFGACAGGSMGGAVPAGTGAFGGAVGRSDAFGQPTRARSAQGMTTGYKRYAR